MQHQQTPPPRQKPSKQRLIIPPEQLRYKLRLNDGSLPGSQPPQAITQPQSSQQQSDVHGKDAALPPGHNGNAATSLLADNNVDDMTTRVFEHLQRKCAPQTVDTNKNNTISGHGGSGGAAKTFYPTSIISSNNNHPTVMATTMSSQPATTSQLLTNAANNNSNQLKSTTTSSSSQRVQRHHQIVSSSTSSTSSSSSSSSSALASELKQSSMKSDIAELKSSISEMKSLSEMSASLKNHHAAKTSLLHQQLRNSIENLMDTDADLAAPDDGSAEPVITFPETPLSTSGGSGAASSMDAGDGATNYNDSHFNNYLSSHPAAMPNPSMLADNGQMGSQVTADMLKFEQKRTHTASKTKVVTDGFSAEKATANTAEMQSLQTNDLNYQQNKATAALHAKVNIDGCLTAEKNVQKTQEKRSLKTSEMSQQDVHATARSAASVRLCGTANGAASAGAPGATILTNGAQETLDNVNDSFITAEKKATSSHSQQQRQTVTASSVYNHEKLVAASTQQSNFTITTGMHHHQSSSSSSLMTEQQKQMMSTSSSHCSQSQPPSQYEELLRLNFDDLDHLCSSSNTQDVERAIQKYSTCLNTFIKLLQKHQDTQKQLQLPGAASSALIARQHSLVPSSEILNKINDIIRKAWSVPKHGHELGLSLCNALRHCGGLDLLMTNCGVDDKNLQYSSAQLLEQCLTTENRAHVVEHGLDKVVGVACVCITSNEIDKSRIGTGILEHLFKHSEATCSDVIQLGGLDKVLFECRKNDVETLRHCAGALANLSLYGGADNQEKMIKRKVPMWLFPLAFHNDDNIKYYACLAIAVLVANKEIEAAVLKSGTLDLVEPFVTSHNPYDFAKSNLAHAHGQSKNWLQRLLPVLSSEREEARNLAAFHFCMEAGIKKQQGNTEIFQEIAAIEPLKKVASCPNAVASKYAAQALQLMGEAVPHKLSQQVPLWSKDDVREWVKQIDFNDYAANFEDSCVDGDLLLQLTEEQLRCDIGIENGIQRQRFIRELQNLKKMADYSSRDVGNLNGFLQSIGPEFSIYTYSMLNAGVDKDSIRKISEDQLMSECNMTNSIHRLRILEAIRNTENNAASPYFFNEYLSTNDNDKSLDVFVSYRRSNGSQLASLLKVHLQLRGFSVFIDVERLEAGKFDNNLLQSIKQAKHFLLVLTPTALERCIDDHDCKDWVHREIVAALQSQCNIIPIFDNFQWPKPEELPEDMRAVCHFNGVSWIHDYQDACIEKLERFLRGDMRADGSSSLINSRGGAPTSSKMSVTSTSDAGTPGTPSIQPRQQPPSYQRMHSNDSAASGGGKDLNGNAGGGGGKD